jgi:hypothetical protein
VLAYTFFVLKRRELSVRSEAAHSCIHLVHAPQFNFNDIEYSQQLAGGRKVLKSLVLEKELP